MGNFDFNCCCCLGYNMLWKCSSIFLIVLVCILEEYCICFFVEVFIMNGYNIIDISCYLFGCDGIDLGYCILV